MSVREGERDRVRLCHSGGGGGGGGGGGEGGGGGGREIQRQLLVEQTLPSQYCPLRACV